MLARHLKAHLFGWSIAHLSIIYDALYKSTHHHHHHHQLQLVHNILTFQSGMTFFTDKWSFVPGGHTCCMNKCTAIMRFHKHLVNQHITHSFQRQNNSSYWLVHTSPSDNSNNHWKRLCLVSLAAAPCVWMLTALTRNLLTYLLTYMHFKLQIQQQNHQSLSIMQLSIQDLIDDCMYRCTLTTALKQSQLPTFPNISIHHYLQQMFI